MRSEELNRWERLNAPGERAERHSSLITHHSSLKIRPLGLVGYEPAWRAMQDFTAARTEDTVDELWMLEHSPVYTLGIAGREEHLRPSRGDIPVIRTDRGGQVTYHGPGQVIAYLLLDIRRRDLGVRSLVRLMERAVIAMLADLGVAAAGRVEAPGVYVGGAKIAALGLRIKRGCCYHGLALNVDMDLAPFGAIDPCGFPGLAVTQTRDLGIEEGPASIGDRLARHLLLQLQAAKGERDKHGASAIEPSPPGITSARLRYAPP